MFKINFNIIHYCPMGTLLVKQNVLYQNNPVNENPNNTLS